MNKTRMRKENMCKHSTRKIENFWNELVRGRGHKFKIENNVLSLRYFTNEEID